MQGRKPITRESISSAALELIEAHGVETLSMRTLASQLGIKAPSLYEHVKNRDEIIALVQAQALTNFGKAFAAAGESRRQKIMFYRQWALEHPKLYPVVFQHKLHRELLPNGLEAGVLAQVIAAVGGSHVQARAVWAQLHGLVDLELQGRLPADADMVATWDQVVITLERL